MDWKLLGTLMMVGKKEREDNKNGTVLIQLH